LLWGWRFDQREPPSNYALEALAVQAVDAVATLTPYHDDAGLLEDVQMAGRCWPAVAEAGGQVPGRQLRAGVGEEENDVAARLVGQRFEDLLDIGQ
jgi:hypothetical protein